MFLFLAVHLHPNRMAGLGNGLRLAVRKDGAGQAFLSYLAPRLLILNIALALTWIVFECTYASALLETTVLPGCSTGNTLLLTSTRNSASVDRGTPSALTITSYRMLPDVGTYITPIVSGNLLEGSRIFRGFNQLLSSSMSTQPLQASANGGGNAGSTAITTTQLIYPTLQWPQLWEAMCRTLGSKTGMPWLWTAMATACCVAFLRIQRRSRGTISAPRGVGDRHQAHREAVGSEDARDVIQIQAPSPSSFCERELSSDCHPVNTPPEGSLPADKLGPANSAALVADTTLVTWSQSVADHSIERTARKPCSRLFCPSLPSARRLLISVKVGSSAHALSAASCTARVCLPADSSHPAKDGYMLLAL